jgi:RND family efflux transporter MFP subunit
MKKILTYSLTAIAAVGLVAFTVIKLNSNKKEVKAKVYHADLNTRAVIQADTIRLSSFNVNTPFLGSFAPNREVSIASETSGKVISVGIQEGSHVAAGSLVAQLDNGVLVAQLHSAQANLAQSKSTLSRYEQAQAGVTQLQMDNARTNILTSQAQIEQLTKQIAQYSIYAPFSGVITKRNFDLGAVVSPGSPLATLIDISVLKLEISVPEKNIPQFKTGAPMQVKTDIYPNAVFRGIINLVSSSADASHNYTVKILIANNSQTPLKAGMYAKVTLGNTPLENTISIPRSALIGSAVKPQVYVVENGVAKLRDIQTGASNESSIQVIKGLSANEVLVTGGLVNLSDGTKVQVK